MADFSQSIGKTLLQEGGYVNDPSDSGGETYRGISRNNFPKWEGWRLIDVNYHLMLDKNTELQGLVVDFYRQNFWQYDGINDQQVADKVFDLSVNVGKVHAIKILQQAAGVTPVDGLYGPNTEKVVNLHPQGSLVTAIRIAAENYHKEVAQAHPEDQKFLADWLRRDEA